ncbi:hypothetical protein PENSPDRAFT_323693 [Peniophora sp. CONT]|nr:hypothetical protein PENSPDRAFT_323693 [Peniophora sp. CONT]
MSTLWRLFSSYIPTVRDDGRELELPILSGSSSSSSSSPNPRGQRHERPRRLAAQTTALKDIRARWDAEEMSEMRTMTLPCANEATPTVRWHTSVKRSHTDGCLPSHGQHLGALISPQESDASASTQSQPSIDSSSGDSESTKVDSMPVPHHERRKSAKGRPQRDREPETKALKPKALEPTAPTASTSPTQMLVLKRELEQLQADLSSTKHELEHQRAVNVHILTQKRKLEGSLARSQAQAAETQTLRAALADRVLTEAARDQTSRDEELATLRAFLDKTDTASGAQVLQAVQDLNNEIIQLAAAVSDEFPLPQTRTGAPTWTLAQAELVRDALGEELCRLLQYGEHGEDPTIVQFAVQGWEVYCCQAVLDAFCTGLAPEVDAYLSALFEEMQTTELQATASRWRALTHHHARALMVRRPARTAPPLSTTSSLSSACSSPLLDLPRGAAAYPTPATTTNNSPIGLLDALPPPPSSQQRHIDGLRAILALAGYTTQPEPLVERFGGAVAHVGKLADDLARMVREGVASAWFSVRVAPARSAFDAGAMENTYAGFGDEAADVLCSVALGLEVVRKRDAGDVERTLLLKPTVVLENVTELL